MRLEEGVRNVCRRRCFLGRWGKFQLLCRVSSDLSTLCSVERVYKGELKKEREGWAERHAWRRSAKYANSWIS